MIYVSSALITIKPEDLFPFMRQKAAREPWEKVAPRPRAAAVAAVWKAICGLDILLAAEQVMPRGC